MYDMIVENSRRILDTPSPMDAKVLPAKGRYRTKAQDQASNKGSTDYGCYGCGSSDHWNKDCPWQQAQNTSQQGIQFSQNLAQSSNLSNKNFSGKQTSRTQSHRKGKGKQGKGNNKGKDVSRNLFQQGKGKGNIRPAARALDWEDNPDYQDYEDYPDEYQNQDQ